MRVNLVEMAGNQFEIQLPEGDTLACGGPEIAKLFNPFKPIGQPEFQDDDYYVLEYDIDPDRAMGVLGVALRRERGW